MKKLIIKIIKNTLYFIVDFISKKIKIHDDIFIRNYSFSPLAIKQKRILIIYTTGGFSNQADKFINHTNVWDSFLIINYFVKNNFVLDIINFNSKKIDEIEENYDIVFGFGEVFEFAKLKNKNALKILYVTEAHPTFVKQSFNTRLNYYIERNNKKPYYIPRVGVYKNDQFINNDYIIKLGTDNNWKDFQFQNTKWFSLYPTSFINSNFHNIKNRSKKNSGYLWFGSAGLIHKGLDLIIEVFSKEPSLSLYISGANKKELDSIYNYKCKNIKVFDFIDVNSNEFLELLDKVTWIVFPSCAEGSSTSVFTCMNHGLIPLISKEAGIDIPHSSGFYFDDYKIDSIRDLILKVNELPIDLINIMSSNAKDFANNNSSRSSYNNSFSKIMDSILE